MSGLLVILGHIVLGCVTIILTLVSVGFFGLSWHTVTDEGWEGWPVALLESMLAVILLCAAVAVGIYNVSR